MSRLDWKRGRFDIDHETNEIHATLRGHQRAQIGDSVEYLRFWKDESETHNIYDEPTGVGRVFHPAVTVPCLHVVHDEGGEEYRDTGFYFNNTIYVTASFDQVARTGLTFMDIEHGKYLNDRIVYNGYLFKVNSINITGQIQRRDIIASIEATQIKEDQRTNDEAPETFTRFR